MKLLLFQYIITIYQKLKILTERLDYYSETTEETYPLWNIYICFKLLGNIDVLIDIKKSENFENNKNEQNIDASHDRAGIFNVI